MITLWHLKRDDSGGVNGINNKKGQINLNKMTDLSELVAEEH